jgi:sporulation related protein
MLRTMRDELLLGLWLTLAAGPALGGAPVEQEGPLSPCVQTPGGASAGSSAAQAQPWGVEIATAFSKEEALEEFARVKQDHTDILGSFDPILVEQCDLHMGTKVQYSARIGAGSREDADALCAKLKTSGGACIVQKN